MWTNYRYTSYLGTNNKTSFKYIFIWDRGCWITFNGTGLILALCSRVTRQCWGSYVVQWIQTWVSYLEGKHLDLLLYFCHPVYIFENQRILDLIWNIGTISKSLSTVMLIVWYEYLHHHVKSMLLNFFYSEVKLHSKVKQIHILFILCHRLYIPKNNCHCDWRLFLILMSACSIIWMHEKFL